MKNYTKQHGGKCNSPKTAYGYVWKHKPVNAGVLKPQSKRNMKQRERLANVKVHKCTAKRFVRDAVYVPDRVPVYVPDGVDITSYLKQINK